MGSNRIGRIRLLIIFLSAVTLTTNHRVEGKTTSDGLDKPCEPNSFRSEFMSGGCVSCPSKLIDCEKEESGDIKRCEMACNKTFLNSTRAAAQPVTKESASKASVESATTSSTTQTTVKQVAKAKPFVVSTTTSSGTEPTDDEIKGNPTRRNEERSKSTDKTIIVGVGCTAVALVILIVLLAVWAMKYHKKSEADEESKISACSHSRYIPVNTTSNSNEDINSTKETNETQTQNDGEGEDRQKEISLSSTIINELEETDL